MNRKTPLLIAVLASAALSAHAQNLVVNPGFETGDFTGWTLSGDTGGCSVSTLHPHSGNFSARLGPLGFQTDGFLDQTITTVVGQSYHVDFWLANIGNVTQHLNAFPMAGGLLALWVVSENRLLRSTRVSVGDRTCYEWIPAEARSTRQSDTRQKGQTI
jgi:hypothetical protein